MGWLAAETLSGLALWLLPFSAAAQWTVVVHTGVGLLFLVPALVYQWQHLRVYWSRPASAVKWMGYLGERRHADGRPLRPRAERRGARGYAYLLRLGPRPPRVHVRASSPSRRRTCW